MKYFSTMRSFFLSAGLSFIFLSILVSCDTSKNIDPPYVNYFVKYYGGSGSQRGVDFVTLDNGDLILLGTTENKKNYIVRTDSEGNILWEKYFGIEDIGKDLEITADGNYVVLSDNFSVATDDSNIKLTKISPADGSVIDSITYLHPANDFGKSITLLKDGGFIVTGTTENTSTFGADPLNTDLDLGDFFSFKFDSQLDSIKVKDWKPIYRFGNKQDVAIKTFQKNNYFYVIGYSNTNLSNTNPDKKLGLIYFQLDGTGSEGLNYSPGALAEDVSIASVIETPQELGEGYFAIGTSVNSIGDSRFFVSKLRPSLTFTSRTNDVTLYQSFSVKDADRIVAVSAAASLASPSGFLLLANELDPQLGTSDIWLTKIDQSGLEKWSIRLGSEQESDFAAAVKELPDGKILVLGTMGIGNSNNSTKMALIKLNSQGQLLK
jgi:hypothetical protein